MFKIIAIIQIYNELEKGNLKRFIKYLKPLVDEIVIYDDGSTDGSYEYLQKITTHVIRGGKNDFKNEIAHKQLLLEKAKALGADFVLWLDADEVLTKCDKSTLQELCQEMIDKNIDGLSMHEINIWRSNTWQRLDSLYNIGWFVRLWRITPATKFKISKQGLHQQQYPATLKKIVKTNFISVLHYGFATEKNLAFKYLTYKAHGQRGYVMLDRLISEEKLQLKKVPERLFPKGLYENNEPKPQKLSFLESLRYVEKYRPQVKRPKYSIACLIYKSTEWLEFVYEQVLKYTDMTDVEFYFVANDANSDVLSYLKNNYIPHYIWNNSSRQRKEWYINNVYRAWNFAAKKAKGDFVIFINSDMAFTENWLENLINAYNGKNCVTSRLIESGKMPSGEFGISKNFGRSIASYKEEKFKFYAKEIAKETVREGGLFMPLFIRKRDFLKVNGYPEGNIVPGSNILRPKIAKEGEVCMSGDVVLMEKLKKKGILHQTAFNSIVYHFQEGEMDYKNKNGYIQNKNIAICNDLLGGIMGEKVLWNYLLGNLPSTYGLDTRLIPERPFERNAAAYIKKKYPTTDVIIQNATFINAIDYSTYTIGFLQDNLRRMGKGNIQQEHNLKMFNKLVTNSLQTFVSYPEYNFEIIPIGVDEKLFHPMNKIKLRQKYALKSKRIGIFVGDFSDVKGWSKIKLCIKKFPDILWILVTKREETFLAKNVKIFNKISQNMLAELYNCADFFIIGSPVETECLAAIEAASCNVPIIMRETGIFSELTIKEKDMVGIFGEDFIKSINLIKKKKFSPRKIVIQKKLTIVSTIKQWRKVLENAKQEIMIQNAKKINHKRKNKVKDTLIDILETYFYEVKRQIFASYLAENARNIKSKLFKFQI